MCFKTGAVVAVIAAVLTTSASAAGTTPAGGVIGIYASPGMSGAVARIVITGAIGDYGTATTIDKDGKVDQNGGYVRIVLKHGGFEVNSIALNKKANAARPTTNSSTTCSFSVSSSGMVTLFNGTGMYAGLNGSAHITETFAGVGPRYASGPKKGKCNMSNNGRPLAFWSGIDGLGKVTF
jgi:hypothetical protein